MEIQHTQPLTYADLALCVISLRISDKQRGTDPFPESWEST